MAQIKNANEENYLFWTFLSLQRVMITTQVKAIPATTTRITGITLRKRREMFNGSTQKMEIKLLHKKTYSGL